MACDSERCEDNGIYVDYVRSQYRMIELYITVTLPRSCHILCTVHMLIHFKSVHSSMYARTLLPERPIRKPSYVHTQSTQMLNTNGVSCKECQTLHCVSTSLTMPRCCPVEFSGFSEHC